MLTRRTLTEVRAPNKRLDTDSMKQVQYVQTDRSLPMSSKLKQSRPTELEGNMPWRSPFYKPTSKVCEEFWYEFLQAAKMLLILDSNRSAADKASPDYNEPDIYAVFNKLRQDIHNELPYNRKFIEGIDKEVERAIAKEMKLEPAPI